MKSIRYFHVDAFTSRVFAGNGAGVCLLDQPLPAETCQKIAAENNLAETAFVEPQGTQFGLRWFTPTMEIDLCGHATLASGFILNTAGGIASDRIEFHSRSGLLSTTRRGDLIELDFPTRPGEKMGPIADLDRALGAQPAQLFKSRDVLAVYDSAEQVAALAPDFVLLGKVHSAGIIATAPARQGADFVCRFFAPGFGVNEDPVTGSAHCTLIPYWSARLKKKKLISHQISARGGVLYCEDRGDRVGIAGHCALYSRGEILLDE